MLNVGIDFCFIFCISLYTVGVHGYVCDVDQAQACKADIISYESVDFPFYGSNENELEETCRAMNKTLECMQDFVLHCDEKPECDGDCPAAVAEISSLWRNTGIPALYSQLCSGDHPYRQSYLEHYSCLERAMDKYAACHNTSQESQHHIATLYEDPENHLAATCCFFSWYQDCYTNATMETCGANATFVVSFALHLLTGHIVQQMCSPLAFCDAPPLPEPNDTSHADESTTISNTVEDSSAESLQTGFKTNLPITFALICFAQLIAKVVY